MTETGLVPVPGGELDAVTAARVADLDARAEEWLEEVKPRNTLRAYAQDWAVWEVYCSELGIPPIPASRGSLVGFVRWLVLTQSAPATINRRLAGVAVYHQNNGVPLSKEVKKGGRDALHAETRRLAKANDDRGRGKARPLTVKELRAIVAACPDEGPAGARDRALVLVGFAIAARRAELADLIIRDLTLSAEGLVVRIRWGKKGAREASIPSGSNPQTCPVRAWRVWLDTLGQWQPGERAFRRVDQWGNIGPSLSPDGVGKIITRVALRAALEHTTAHGLRAGLATEARRAGHDAKTIATQGGWSPTSSVLYEYMRIVDRFADNAIVGIGL